MKNKEFFKKELEEIMVKGKSFGIHKTTGNLIGCAITSCENCAFRETNKMCMEFRQEWLEQEHVEEDKWKDFRHLKKGDLIEIRLEDGWYFRSFHSIYSNVLHYSTRAEESYIYDDFLFTTSDPSRVRLPEFKENKEKEYYDKWKKAEAACKRFSNDYDTLADSLLLSKLNNANETRKLNMLRVAYDALILENKELKEKEDNKEKEYYEKWKKAEAACKRLSDDYKDLMERFNEREHKIHRLRMDLALGKVNNEHKVQTLTQLKDVNDILIGKLKDQLSDARVQIETLNKDFETQRKLIAEQKDKNEKLNQLLDIKDDVIKNLKNKSIDDNQTIETLNKDFEAQRKLNENQQVMIQELRKRLQNRCDQSYIINILKSENKELEGKLSEIENVLAKKTGNKHDDIADSISYSLRSKKEVKGEKTFTNVNCNSFIGLKYGPKDLW